MKRSILALALCSTAAFATPVSASCLLTLELSQTTYSLSISTYIKNKMNTAEFELPVEAAYYEHVRVGQNLQDDMRWGSIALRGSFGHWNVIVKDKRVVGECK
jgi:hypothetical protein